MTLLLRGGRVLAGNSFAPADVRVVGDRIEAVRADLPVGPGDEVWELDGDLVIPGLVNAHYHSPDNLNTGRLPHAPLELWSLDSIPSRSDDPEMLALAAELGAAQLLRGGVTAVVDMVRPASGLEATALDAVAGVYERSGMRAVLAPVVADLSVEQTLPLEGAPLPGAGSTLSREQLAATASFFDRWHGRAGRLAVHVAPSGPQRCSDELLAGAIDLAARLGTQLHTHALETRAQALQARRRWGEPMLAHLDRIGGLGPQTVLAHLAWPEPEEVTLVAGRAATVVHNPASNCALGGGRAPVTRLLAAGATVALGTDAATCNDGLSMFESAKLAAILSRPDEPDWERWVSAPRAFGMATEGGAAALGLAGQLGRVSPGYLADLVVLDAASPAFVPPNDLVHQLVMRGGPDLVRHVFVAGRPVVRDRALLMLDWPGIARQARATVPPGPGSATGAPSELRSSVERMLRGTRRIGGDAGT